MRKEHTFRVVDGGGFTFAPVPTQAIEFLPVVGAYAFSVYVILVSYTRPGKDDVYPSLTTLVSKAGFSKPTVISAIATLENHQLISVERSGSHNTYTLRPVSDFVKEICEKTGEVVNDVDLNPPPASKAALPEEEVKQEKKNTDPRIRSFFDKWARTGIIDPTPKGYIVGRIKALPEAISCQMLDDAISAFMRAPDPWVKSNMGMTAKGLFHQLPRLLPKQQAAPEKKSRVVLTENGPELRYE